MRPPQPDSLLIYGAGLAGQRIHRALARRGHTVHGFLDRDTTLQEVNSLPVTTAGAWARENDEASACVIVGLFNPLVDTGAVIRELQAQGYGKVVNLVELMRDYLEGEAFHYWLVDPRFYDRHADRIATLRASLADTTSQALLDCIVEFRTNGDASVLPPPDPQQYFPKDLPRWPQALRFIDCGGYTGDTVQALEAAGYRFEALATFEPNLTQYAMLTSNLKHIAGAAHFPCGVSDSNRLAGFDPSLGAGGHLLEAEGEPIVCLRLDDALPGFAPNLIKMDIEGEEPAALRGAINLIRQYRPHLAISIYHRPEHLWELQAQIQALALGYRFHLRCHAMNTFDTILYAIAE